MEKKKLNERKVAQVLLDLTPATWKRFRDFLDSPYFNVSEKTRDFYVCLEDEFLQGDWEMDEEAFFANWQAGAAYDSDALGQRFFRLGEELGRFFAVERLQGDADLAEQLSLEEMLDHDLEDLYSGKAKRFQRDLFKGQAGSWAGANLRLRHLLRHVPYLLHNDQQGEVRIVLEQLLSELDNFATLTEAMAVSSLLNGAFLAGEGVIHPMLDDLEEPLEDAGPLLTYYLRVIRLQKAELEGDLDEARAAYVDLKAWLLDKSGQMGEEERLDACIHALNFCLRRNNAGDDAFPAEAEIAEWYALLMRWYLDRGQVNWVHFLNYGSLLTKKGELGKAEKLLREVKGKLSGSFGEGVQTYMKGMVHYQRGELREALRCFRQVQNGPLLPQVGALNRTMVLRTLFELGEYGEITHQAESFRQYLGRAGKRLAISKQRVKAFKEFGRLLVKVWKLQNDPAASDRKREKLREEIRVAEVVSKDWLLGQLA